WRQPCRAHYHSSLLIRQFRRCCAIKRGGPMKNESGDKTRSTADFLLEGLAEIGIDYLFCNMGTDHAPIIEELARRREQGQTVPKIIRCPHESTAAHMAAGYALVTGKGQGVLVHVDVGTANASMAMHNLFRSRLPVLLRSEERRVGKEGRSRWAPYERERST